MNPLEAFILDNREELDEVEKVAQEAIWQRIEGGLDKDKPLKVVVSNASPWQLNIGRNWKLTIAAGLALFIGMGLWLALGQGIGRSTNDFELAQFSSELAQEQARYIQLINQKEAEIGFDQLDKKAFQEVFQELAQLEEIHGEFLRDLPSFQAKEEVIHTLTKYYERKIRILERLSREMEKNYQQEKRINEKRI